jgi:hypothetical protein
MPGVAMVAMIADEIRQTARAVVEAEYLDRNTGRQFDGLARYGPDVDSAIAARVRPWNKSSAMSCLHVTGRRDPPVSALGATTARQQGQRAGGSAGSISGGGSE